MDDMNRIIEKIKNILARADASRNDNEHERAIAMRQAHALLAKHGLEMADIEIEGEHAFGPLGRVKVKLGSAVWQGACAVEITNLYGCFVYEDPDGLMNLVGRKAQVQVARQMIDYVIASILREGRKIAAASRQHGRTVMTSFGNGAARGIKEQVASILAAQKAGQIGDEQVDAGRALIVVAQHEKSLVESKTTAETLVGGKFKTVHSSTRSGALDAHFAGYQHGKNLSLNNQIGGSSQHRIGGGS